MIMALRLRIITPERRVYVKDVDMVIAPGVEGQLGILPHHAPLITALTYGELRVKRGGDEESFAIGGGYMEVQPDGVTVLANTAEHVEEIDLDRATATQNNHIGNFGEQHLVSGGGLKIVECQNHSHALLQGCRHQRLEKLRLIGKFEVNEIDLVGL